jgi:ELWxxDGT repeat protein
MRHWLLSWWRACLKLVAEPTKARRSSERLRLRFEQLEDRTVPATFLVRDIFAGISSSFPDSFAEVNGTLFFVAHHPSFGRELWMSDGTSTGTVLVRDIWPGTEGSYPQYLTNVDGTLFFVASDGLHGRELWKSDGTSTGTALVRDIRPGQEDSNPRHLTNVNGTLFFSANDGIRGVELWRSNGTPASTLLVRDISPGSTSSGPGSLANVHGTLFFSAFDSINGRELWKSNGTSTGTALVHDIRPGSAGSDPRYLTNVNGTLFFSADNGLSGRELWISNGSSIGTMLVRDIRSGTLGSDPAGLTNINGTLFFSADDGTSGRELWRSNGTSSTTVLVLDIRPGSAGSDPRYFTNVDVTLFFSADNGASGRELWISKGSSTDTMLVRDLRPGLFSASPSWLSNVNGTLFFSADDGISAPTFAGRELWRSNGTSAGTVLVRDIRPGTTGSNPSWLTNVNGKLFFSASDPANGVELWATDDWSPTIVSVTGPPAGTYTVGQSLDFTVQFNEVVTAIGTPRLQLTIGSTTRFASYLSGSGTTTLIFRYTVQAGDLDTDGIAVVSPLDLSGGVILDFSGNTATPNFTSPDTSGVRVDGVTDAPPTIVLVRPPANGRYVTGQVLDILVRFSEPVNVGTTSTAKPYIRLRIGSVIRNAVFHSKPNAATLRFRYVIQSSDRDTNGIEILSPIMRPAGTFIRDLAGNDAIVTFAPPSTSGVLVN